MFKAVFLRLVAFTFRPMDAWEALSHKKVKENDDDFLSHFLYPMIGLIALAAFVGMLFTGPEFDFVIALKSTIKAIVASAGGFFLASYLLNELWALVFKRPRSMRLIQPFVGYSSSLLFVIEIVQSFFPELIFLRIPALYDPCLVHHYRHTGHHLLPPVHTDAGAPLLIDTGECHSPLLQLIHHG